MVFHLHLFFEYFKQYMKIRFVYRWDFFTQFLTDLLFQFANLIFIFIMFHHTAEIQGWVQAEVLFIYGYFLIPWAIFTSFFNLWDFNEVYIIKGELDRILTRPIHSLLQIMMEKMVPESLVGVITGFVIMGLAIAQLDLHWYWYDFILFILFVLGGVAVYAGIYIALTSISLYSDSKTDIQPIMFNIGNYGRYPINVYHRFIQIILTWFLPFAFVGFYPASYLLEQHQWKNFALLTPVVGLICFIIGVFIWNHGIKYYRGAGN